MLHRRASRALLLAVLTAGLPLLSACASTVDSVNPQSYISNTAGRWYRVQVPHSVSNAPVAAPFPETCKSPASRMGQPEGC